MSCIYIYMVLMQSYTWVKSLFFHKFPAWKPPLAVCVFLEVVLGVKLCFPFQQRWCSLHAQHMPYTPHTTLHTVHTPHAVLNLNLGCLLPVSSWRAASSCCAGAPSYDRLLACWTLPPSSDPRSTATLSLRSTGG